MLVLSLVCAAINRRIPFLAFLTRGSVVQYSITAHRSAFDPELSALEMLLMWALNYCSCSTWADCDTALLLYRRSTLRAICARLGQVLWRLLRLCGVDGEKNDNLVDDIALFVRLKVTRWSSIPIQYNTIRRKYIISLFCTLFWSVRT